MCLSGNITNPGMYEIEMGFSLGDVIEKLGGGIDLEKGLWYIPDVGIHIIEGSILDNRSIQK